MKDICFVVMPFQPDFNEIYSLFLKPTIQKTGTLAPVRADEIYGPRPIMADIWRSIREATLVVADLTGRNPNVFYELGLAHAIRKPVIMVSQSMDDVPFDLRHLRVIIYKNTGQGCQDFVNHLSATLRVVIHDLKQASGLGQYIVLTHQQDLQDNASENSLKLIKPLSTDDPTRAIQALEQVAELFKYRKHPRKCDPKMLAAITPHFHSPFAEVQLAAIRALKAAGDEIHASNLYGFLETKNPVLMEEALQALGELRDHSIASRLVRMYADSQFEASRETILRTLGELHADSVTTLFLKVINDTDASTAERQIAVSGLVGSGPHGADSLLELNFRQFDIPLRAKFAEALAWISSNLLMLYKSKIEKLEKLLRVLASDQSPQVRGAALAAWCMQSFEPFDGPLNRDFLWERLLVESAEVVEVFIGIVVQYRDSFGQEDSGHLVQLGKLHPVEADTVVFYLRAAGDESAWPYMLENYPEHPLAVLDYLSRLPNPEAIAILRQEIEVDEDTNHVVLAAIALTRLGAEDLTSIILGRGPKVYPWVKGKIKRFLEERIDLEVAAAKRAALRKALKKF